MRGRKVKVVCENFKLRFNLVENRQGATAIEYALIGSLISIAIIGALIFFAGGVTNLFNTISNTLQPNI